MLIVRRYKKSRSGRPFWEYKVYYKDPYNREKTRVKRRGGFQTKEEAERAANEILMYLRLPVEGRKSRS